MKSLRRKFGRFIYNHSSAGIPNLMLILCIATAISYVILNADRSFQFYNFLRFDRGLILQGQVWRLITYIILPYNGGFWLFLTLFAYYGIGRMVERAWGTLKFNLFYLCGIILMDAAAMLLGFLPVIQSEPSAWYLNLSLFLALATMYPESRVMLMFVIPVKMKYLAMAYLAMLIVYAVQLNFFPVLALLNYFLFFGPEFISVLPLSWQQALRRAGRSHVSKRPNANWASAYQRPEKTASRSASRSSSRSTTRVVDAPAYRHKCTVCGRTDVSNPDLEFRYCSRCNGYYCYCEDHINNHAHIQ